MSGNGRNEHLLEGDQTFRIGVGPVGVAARPVVAELLDAPPLHAHTPFHFEVPDEFVVGYGLDFADAYRNLPDIYVLRSAVFAKA